MGSDTETVTLNPGSETGESWNRPVADEADKSVAAESPTPVRVIAQLTQDPGPAPRGFTVLTSEGITIGLLNSGDAIGIDGRWCPVKGCIEVNGWVTVDTAFGYPVVTAFTNVPIHLARVIDVEEVAV